VKKAVMKTEPLKGGFIGSTIAPVNERHGLRFGFWDAVEIIILIVSLLFVMRLILAH
jgi:hypothetical protein